MGSGSATDGEVAEGSNEGPRVFKGRPGGTKAAKEDHFKAKQREGGLYAQAAATDKMAEAQMLKAVELQDQNLLLLMTTDDASLVNVEALEYVQLRRAQELRKLKARLAEEEEERDFDVRRKRRGSAGLEPAADEAAEPEDEEDRDEDEDDGPDEQVKVVFETQSPGLANARPDVDSRLNINDGSYVAARHDVHFNPDGLDRSLHVRDSHARSHTLGVRSHGLGVRRHGDQGCRESDRVLDQGAREGAMEGATGGETNGCPDHGLLRAARESWGRQFVPMQARSEFGSGG